MWRYVDSSRHMAARKFRRFAYVNNDLIHDNYCK
jgi:hypothetical protein